MNSTCILACWQCQKEEKQGSTYKRMNIWEYLHSFYRSLEFWLDLSESQAHDFGALTCTLHINSPCNPQGINWPSERTLCTTAALVLLRVIETFLYFAQKSRGFRLESRRGEVVILITVRIAWHVLVPRTIDNYWPTHFIILPKN